MLTAARVFVVFGQLRQKVVYAATIAGLLLLLWIGHHTHWRLSEAFQGSVSSHGPTHVDRRVDKSRPDDQEIAPRQSDDGFLDVSDSALAKAGVELSRVERGAMSSSIVASGVVAYNQNL